jgi:hypothetical protein
VAALLGCGTGVFVGMPVAGGGPPAAATTRLSKLVSHPLELPTVTVLHVPVQFVAMVVR